MADISLDAELRAMQDIATILHRLDQPTRARILHWIADRFQADAAAAANLTAATRAAGGVTLSAETADDSLSVATLGDLFDSDRSDMTPSDQPKTEPARGIAADDLSEFLDRADAGTESKNRPAVKPEIGPAWPILPKPILT